MKKLVLFVAAIVATLSFVSCGGSKEEAVTVDSTAIDTVEVVDSLVVDTTVVDTVAL